ncbi:DUF2961 domain-containing protein [Desertihabitans brevis]|uniref:DUF2961 domain-containing protein n=2 Tax=Desertihabitans brevis TaxID=2268447 RepID=A0A367YT04_9ACTN|nr:DUF2961 domain-containing protein [Desertihabitans brevis]
MAARTASALGPGRKGSPALPLPAGETITLADVEGPGVIRHLWITVPDRTPAGPFVLRDLVLRIFWDDAEQPAVEVPLGDFFCNGFAERAQLVSEPIVVAPTGGMNCYFPMPFRRRARITLESQHEGDLSHVFFQVDCTTGDEVAEDAGYLHAQWRRSNGTTALGQDHVILDGVRGRGTYVGTFVALTSLHRYWWGEGEVKFFLDGDREHPSLCSTGLEDYAGGAWAFQDELRTSPEPTILTYSAPWSGYHQHDSRDRTRFSEFATEALPMHGMYRWHLPDPIYFEREIAVTVQQIGCWEKGLFERSDDVSTVAYWYQQGGQVELPPLPTREQRWPR